MPFDRRGFEVSFTYIFKSNLQIWKQYLHPKLPMPSKPPDQTSSCIRATKNITSEPRLPKGCSEMTLVLWWPTVHSLTPFCDPGLLRSMTLLFPLTNVGTYTCEPAKAAFASIHCVNLQTLHTPKSSTECIAMTLALMVKINLPSYEMKSRNVVALSPMQLC
jgi:hypothetical protein